MLLINKLTAPGGIRRVELRPETIVVLTYDGAERLYRVAPTGEGAKRYTGGDKHEGGIDKIDG